MTPSVRTSLLLTLALSAGAVSAAPKLPGDKHLSVPIRRGVHGGPVKYESTLLRNIRRALDRNELPRKLRRRQSNETVADGEEEPFTVTIDNVVREGGYFADLDIGTPGQEVTLVVDTGSTISWITRSDAPSCGGFGGVDCTNLTLFNPDDSSSFEVAERGEFQAQYVDGSETTGDFITETVSIGDQIITGQHLGLSDDAIDVSGILGLGLTVSQDPEFQFPSVLDTLVDQNQIERAVFSLYLNDLSARAGGVLFGGIDTEKFFGELQSLPLVPGLIGGTTGWDDSDGEVYHYAVNFKGVTPNINGDSRNIEFSRSYPTPLDSGSTLTLMPDSMIRDIVDHVPATYTGLGVIIDCNLGTASAESQYVGFTFSGVDGDVTLNVPIEELVVPSALDLSGIPQDAIDEVLDIAGIDSVDDICVFGLQPWEALGASISSFVLMGDTVLRSAYLVYDAGNKVVAMAQASHNIDAENIVELKEGEEGIPGLEGSGPVIEFGDSASSRVRVGALGALSLVLAVGFALV